MLARKKSPRCIINKFTLNQKILSLIQKITQITKNGKKYLYGGGSVYYINPPIVYIISSPVYSYRRKSGNIYIVSLLFAAVLRGVNIMWSSLLRVSLVVTLRHEQRRGVWVAAAPAAVGAAASDQRHSLPPRLLVSECQRMVRPCGIKNGTNGTVSISLWQH